MDNKKQITKLVRMDNFQIPIIKPARRTKCTLDRQVNETVLNIEIGFGH
jgi:hypothetical protein